MNENDDAQLCLALFDEKEFLSLAMWPRRVHSASEGGAYSLTGTEPSLAADMDFFSPCHLNIDLRNRYALWSGQVSQQ